MLMTFSYKYAGGGYLFIKNEFYFIRELKN